MEKMKWLAGVFAGSMLLWNPAAAQQAKTTGTAEAIKQQAVREIQSGYNT